ncbi:MAG: phosphoglucosamine mutase [Candidatus Anammoxibacter sp.]
MKKLFGTDGIRGKVNTYPLTGDVAFRLGQAVASQFANKSKCKVVIGKDTRLSGCIFEYAITAGLCSMGADVYLAGLMTTPGVAHLVRTLSANVGVVISASHNPAEDNGIKLFDGQGYKLSDEVECDIEKRILSTDSFESSYPMIEDTGKVNTINNADESYTEFAKSTVNNVSFKGLKVVLDCAHGAAYKVAPQIFTELGAEVTVYGNKPDGLNINKDHGALHPEVIKSAVRKQKADIGVALDGDADRVTMVDENGNIFDGDHILAVCGLYMHETGSLRNNTIVGTVMSNMGFELFLKERGIKLIRTDVGDRYIIQEMRKNDYNLGGEQSGHIILSDFNSTGDGTITALQVMNIMQKTGKKLSELKRGFTPFPQLTRNINVKEKKPFHEMENVEKTILDVEKKLEGHGRVLVRYSGTEKKCRVMVECDDSNKLEEYAQIIINEIDKEVGE